MGLPQLIAEYRSPAEAEAFQRHDLTKGEVNLMAITGREVLRQFPYDSSAGACAHIAAMWATNLKDVCGVPAYVTAGNLSLNGRRIYHSDRSAASLRADFACSSLAYDGHFWLSVPGMVGDASVFRSAYSEALDHWFRLLVEQSFGTGRGIYIGPANGELAYTPKYVLSDDEILALVNAASILFGDD